MFNIFKKNSNRDIRDLLRENLKTIPVDMFSYDDPMMKLTNEEKLLYLKHFADLYTDQKFEERIKFLVNRQAQKTLTFAKDGVEDLAGAMNINGMAVIIDDVKKLANMYIKETTKPVEEPLDKFKIIPTIDRI